MVAAPNVATKCARRRSGEARGDGTPMRRRVQTAKAGLLFNKNG